MTLEFWSPGQKAEETTVTLCRSAAEEVLEAMELPIVPEGVVADEAVLRRAAVLASRQAQSYALNVQLAQRLGQNPENGYSVSRLHLWRALREIFEVAVLSRKPVCWG